MHKHRRIEIAIREHLGNVPEVRADLIPAFGVLHIVGANVDSAAVIAEFKMMRGLLVRESHHRIAAFGHVVLVVLLAERQCGKRKQEKAKQASFHIPYTTVPS